MKAAVLRWESSRNASACISIALVVFFSLWRNCVAPAWPHLNMTLPVKIMFLAPVAEAAFLLSTFPTLLPAPHLPTCSHLLSYLPAPLTASVEERRSCLRFLPAWRKGRVGRRPAAEDSRQPLCLLHVYLHTPAYTYPFTYRLPAYYTSLHSWRLNIPSAFVRRMRLGRGNRMRRGEDYLPLGWRHGKTRWAGGWALYVSFFLTAYLWGGGMEEGSSSMPVRRLWHFYPSLSKEEGSAAWGSCRASAWLWAAWLKKLHCHLVHILSLLWRCGIAGWAAGSGRILWRASQTEEDRLPAFLPCPIQHTLFFTFSRTMPACYLLPAATAFRTGRGMEDSGAGGRAGGLEVYNMSPTINVRTSRAATHAPASLCAARGSLCGRV